MDDFVIFRRFNKPEQAIEMAEELGKHEIEYEIIEDEPGIDITFTGNSEFQKETQLMIRPSDFEKAYQILEADADEELKDIPADHYLFEFSTEELNDIISKRDEWSSLDYRLALKLLKERGQVISEDHIKSLKEERIIELAKPDKDQGGWIVFAYVLSLLGGLLGVLIGWYLWTMKKTLPNGEKVYAYSASDRWQGRRIFFLGIIIFVSEFLLALFYKMELL